MVFYDNLLFACEKKGIKVTPLVIECGGASGSISNWKKGASPNSDIVLKLATRLNVSTDYLLTGKEKFSSDNLDIDQQELMEDYKTLSDIDKARVLERVKTLKELDDTRKAETARRKKALEAASKEKTKTKITPFPEPELTEESEDEEKYIDLPFPDIPASAGTGMYLVSDYAETIHVLATDEARKADYAIKVSGKSMEPRYYDGDILAVCEQPAVDPGEVGVFVYNGERYVKQFGGNRLISINPDYQDIFIEDPDSFFCQGKVLSVLQIARK